MYLYYVLRMDLMLRLVKGMCKKTLPQLGIEPQTSRFTGDVLAVHHCDSLVHTPLYCTGATEVPQSQHLAATPHVPSEPSLGLTGNISPSGEKPCRVD